MKRTPGQLDALRRAGLRAALMAALVLAGLAAPARAAADARAVLDEADAAYAATNFQAAARLYEKALALGFHAGGVYYNLGNAYYRQGHLGKAIAAYLRARRLMPRDGDVLANLDTARAQAEDGVVPPEPPAALRTFLFLHYYASLDELLWALGIMSAVLFLGMALHAFVPARALRTTAVIVALLMLPLAAAAAAHYYTQFVARTVVITADRAPVRAGYDTSYAEVFTLHAGTEARLLDRQGAWLKIELDRKRGWIQADDAEVL